jgi:hypothetical protein
MFSLSIPRTLHVMAGVQLMMMIITRQLGTPSGRCDEHSSKLFLQLETKVLSIRRGADKRVKVMLASFATALDNL